MPIKKFKIKSFDGLKLNSCTWLPEADVKVRARILFMHGFSEYIEIYDEWFSTFVNEGFEVTSYDQRGHGDTAKSPADFGISNEKSVMGDLEAVMSYVTENYDGPLIFWGFSMGGAVALNYMAIGKLRKKVDLYIVLSPFIQPHETSMGGVNGMKLKALPYLARWFPNRVDEVETFPERITNDPEKWERFNDMPKRHMRTSAALMNDALTRGRRLLDPSFLKKMDEKPLFLAQGDADMVSDYPTTKEFFELSKLKDQTFRIYPGLPHSVMMCLPADQDRYRSEVLEWIGARLDK